MSALKFWGLDATTKLKKLFTAITTSAGAGDASKIAATDASGRFDETLMSRDFVGTSAGAGDSTKVPYLDGTGRLDTTFMPVGVAADTASLTASENLAAGDFINVWDDAGTFKARKADASDSGKMAHGFVLSAYTLGNTALVYFEGTNTQLSGLAAGEIFLSAATAGGVVAAGSVDTTTGYLLQKVGTATSTTSANVELNQASIL